MKRGVKSCLRKIFTGDTVIAKGKEPSPTSAAGELNGETSVLQPAYTKRLKPEPDFEQTVSGRNQPTLCEQTEDASIAWCGLTDTGRVRTHNEDFFSCTDLKKGMLFVVADGMGGHDAGEVASRLVAEAISRVAAAEGDGVDPGKVLEQAVLQANAEVLHEAESKGSNMGTTVTAALVAGEKAYIANVGDSRTYWIENGSIKRITEDHSLVEKLVSLGKMTREEARAHPKSNVLYRNIGSEGPLKVDIFQVPLRKGGSLLLCTDGLWGEVTDESIHRIFMTEKDARKTCAKLVKTANECGGNDNITAIVVKVV